MPSSERMKATEGTDISSPISFGACRKSFSSESTWPAPQAASTTDLLENLRNHVIPDATRGTGLDVLVGGQTAIFGDFATKPMYGVS